MQEYQYLLRMENITKKFPGVIALNNVNLNVKHTEIHAVVGENGAGKSTLMNILSGTFPYGTYSGNIIYNNKVIKFKDIKQSEKAGIAIIHQELALTPYLSIAENMFIGNEIARHGVIDWNATYNKAAVYLKKLGLKESPDTQIARLGVGKQQLVEIAKVLAKNATLLILDEPTAALNEQDSEVLLNLLVDLKKQGITIILISHHLNEVAKFADSVTILRDGHTIETLDVIGQKLSEDRIIKGMVGREIVDRFPKRSCAIGKTIFEVKNWNVYHPQQTDRKIINNINLNIKSGEVVGIAGLMGSGRTELATSIFGRYYGSHISGEIYVHGKKADISSIPKAIRHGLVYVTENRKEEGLVLIKNVKENVTLSNLHTVTTHNILDENQEIIVTDQYVDMLNIKTSSILQQVVNLSGGNQQKVVLAKWIFANPEILILDEPTRGIDVGAKYEIYTIINQLAEKGKGCLLISSELGEVIGMSDRIYVMSDGVFVAELDKKDASQELIMQHIINKQKGK